jgi:hypothetical protein
MAGAAGPVAGRFAAAHDVFASMAEFNGDPPFPRATRS